MGSGPRCERGAYEEPGMGYVGALGDCEWEEERWWRGCEYGSELDPKPTRLSTDSPS